MAKENETSQRQIFRTLQPALLAYALLAAMAVGALTGLATVLASFL